MLYKSMIKLISLEDAQKMLFYLTDSESPGENMPKGLFLWKEGNKWIAMNNLDDYAWIEEFTARHKAERWLVGIE